MYEKLGFAREGTYRNSYPGIAKVRHVLMWMLRSEWEARYRG